MKYLIATLLGIVGFANSIAQDFEYSFKESYQVASPSQLDLSSFDGNLDVYSTEGSSMQIFYIVRKGGRLLKIDRDALEKELILETSNSSNAVRVIVRNKMQNQGFNFQPSTVVHFKVYVPKNTACNLNTSDGSISLNGLHGAQLCKTSDGSIEVTNVSGNIKAKTSDGDVHIKQIDGLVNAATSDGSISLIKVLGDVHASTSDGNIMLNNVKGDIAVKTSDGYIDFKEISGSFKASTSDGNIQGNLIDLKNELTLRTSGGNINVKIPSNLGLDLDIRAESIDIPFKNFTGKFDDKFVRGQSNGGGIPVVLSTSDGNVKLHH